MTAVKWLRKELETIPSYSAFYGNNYQWIDSIMNEAKEIEKQQIIDAYDEGQQNPYEYSEDQDVNWYDGRRHYNETFKNTNK